MHIVKLVNQTALIIWMLRRLFSSRKTSAVGKARSAFLRARNSLKITGTGEQVKIVFRESELYSKRSQLQFKYRGCLLEHN